MEAVSSLSLAKEKVPMLEENIEIETSSFTHCVKMIFDFSHVFGEFKLHCSPSILAKELGIPPNQVFDFVKELVNQTTGIVKRNLGADESVGFFLPILLRQYHDLFFNDATETFKEKNEWIIKIGAPYIKFSLCYSVRNQAQLDESLNNLRTTSSKIEFL